ncbi:MAG: M48 family metallopeptidase, partial [Bdellovibrionales bacterium]|nr:M48 family metallopeptidase [Bdellovibrionales bacterium]
TELLKNSETENELGFVICHEIGHFVHRDVIRGLSTRFMLLAALSLLGLSDNNLGIVDAGVNSSLLSYSRNQESRADEFAITCASKKYGHIEGFDTFFMRAKKQNPKVLDSKFFQYMSTHPISDERIKHLVEFAQSRGISSKGPLTKQTLGDKKDQ